MESGGSGILTRAGKKVQAKLRKDADVAARKLRKAALAKNLEDISGSIEDLATLAAAESQPEPLTPEREEQRARFDVLCRRLNIANEYQTRKIGWDLLSQVPMEECGPDHEPYWSACALFIAGGNKKKNERANVVKISQLLKECNISMVDFFDPLKTFIGLLKLGPDYDDMLKGLERKFVVTSILFQKYERMYADLLVLPTDRVTPTGKASDAYTIFSFGWLLFLVAKGKLLSNPNDLINCFHLLVCVVDLLFTNAPSNMRLSSLRDPPFGPGDGVDMLSEKPPLYSSTLHYICELSGANYTEVVDLQENLFIAYMKMLSNVSNNTLKCTSAKLPSEAILSKSSVYFGNILDAFLSTNMKAINKEYEYMYYNNGDFDERLFIDQPEQIGTPSRVPSQTRNYFHLRKGLPEQPNAFASPYKHAVGSVDQRSPMTVALSTIKWLKVTVERQPDGPSATLLKFFEACNKVATDSILERVQTLGGIIEEHFTAGQKENPWNEKPRVELGVKLYYRVLEAMLQSESERLQQNNFTTLLNHEIFHRSLLACCIEIVLFCYKMTEMTFPFILTQFQITPFAFCKIIECVVKYETELPRVVVRHMSAIEEKILEFLAWQEGSPLLDLVQDPENQQLIAIQARKNPSPATPSLSALASPVPPGKGTRPNNVPVSPMITISPAPNSQANSLTSPRKASSHSLDLFFRKVFFMSSKRALDLCCRLQVPTKIYDQVWATIVELMSKHAIMMKNRHLDQIIMSAIYGVCRVNELKITFRAIIEQYRTQPQASSKIFREVLLLDEEKGDIITFYNNVFIPSMEGFLLQFQVGDEGRRMASPEKKQKLPASPHKANYSSSHNIYLSPLKQSRFLNATPGSVKPKLFFSIGASPAKNLAYINAAVNSPNPRAARSKKKLNFDVDEDGENGKRKRVGADSSEEPSPKQAKRTI